MKVRVGVDERILLRHEIELEVTDKKSVSKFLDEIEERGIDQLWEIEKKYDGIKVEDAFIEEVPDECDDEFETYIIEVVEDDD